MLAQTTGYAITAIGYIAAKGGKPVHVQEIADACGIPSPYLRKIVNTLARRQLLVTRPGSKGGAALALPPEQISLYDICFLMDDPIIHESCMLGTAKCSDERRCPCHVIWKPRRIEILRFLQKTTAKDIARFMQGSASRKKSQGGIRP
ncbi:MAG: Rrf2 family transcriptional regulator [Fimbriimonadales bacterium]|nr:Rrf2 family transcriptional regulator [Fimbriimonadales bacterium]